MRGRGQPRSRASARKGGSPQRVIGVAVRVDGGGHRAGIDRAHEREGPRARRVVRGVDEHEPLAGAHHRHVGEGVQEDDAGRRSLPRWPVGFQNSPAAPRPTRSARRGRGSARSRAPSSGVVVARRRRRGPGAASPARAARRSSLSTTSSTQPRAANRRCGRTPGSRRARAWSAGARRIHRSRSRSRSGKQAKSRSPRK